MTIRSPSPEKGFRVRYFRTRRIGFVGQRKELLEVRAGLLAVAGGFGGARRASEAAITVGVLLERGLELTEHGRGLPRLEQQLTEELSHRIEPVLHRHVLDAAVFALGGHAHQLHCLVTRTFRVGHPGRDREDLLFGAVRSVGLVRLLQRAAKVLQRLDLAPRSGQITAARHAETASEADEGVRHGARGRGDRQRGRPRPVASLERVTRRDRGDGRVVREERVLPLGSAAMRSTSALARASCVS
jgi:hypothetical protein